LAKWEEDFDERNDPNGKKYYWLTGKFVNHDKGDDTDEWALANGYASIVPVQFDLTAHYAQKLEDIARKADREASEARSICAQLTESEAMA
jgi:5'-nucleotidase